MKLVNVIGKYLQPGRSWYKRSVGGITKLVVHHSVTYTEGKTNDQMLNELFQIHKANDWPGLSYHRVITPDGTVYQINNQDDLTWTDSINTDSMAVCMIGYFHSPANMKPTKEQLVALKECLDEWTTKHPEFPADKDDVWGHRDRWATACPGDLLYPYPTEYRTKLGDVNWEGATPSATDPLMEIRKSERDTLVGRSTVAKEVAEYLELSNPDQAPTKDYKNVIGGFKSTATEAKNRAEKAETDLEKANTEVANQKDKLANKEVEWQRSDKLQKAEIDALKKATPDLSKVEGLYKGQIEDLQKTLREAQKAGGIKDIEITELKKKLEQAQKGIETRTLLQIVVEFLSGIKIAK